jgi:hypothetical protein
LLKQSFISIKMDGEFVAALVWFIYKKVWVSPLFYYNENGIYRPSQNSKMLSLGRGFDAVSREKVILDIYALVDPLDGWLDDSLQLFNPDSLWVEELDSNIIDVEWFLDDLLLDDATSSIVDIGGYGLAPGDYTLKARAYDPTGFDATVGWVRRDTEQLEQFVTWNVTFSAVPEPSMLLLMVMGLFGLGMAKWKGQRGRSEWHEKFRTPTFIL